MSSYQKVTVVAVEDHTVTIEVVEDSADSRALSSIFDEGDARGIDDGKETADEADWLKIGAMLLLGEKAMEGEVEPQDDLPEPEQFVTDVRKIEASPIGAGNSGNQRYRAVLEIDVATSELAEIFSVGESFDAVADLGGDFEDMFG